MKKTYALVLLSLVSCIVSMAGTTINFAMFKAATDEAWMKQVKEAYEKAYPGNKLIINTIGGSTGSDYYTKCSLMLRSGDKIDVLYEDSFMLKSDISSGVLSDMPAETWNEWSNIFQSLRESATSDGKVYGVPLDTDTRALYYNLDIFKKAGLPVPWQPKNWNDILDTAKKIKEKVPDVIPFACNVAANGESTTMQTFEMLLYGTDDPLYKDGKWLLNSKGFLDSLKFIDTLYKEKLGAPLDIVLNPQYGNKVLYNLAPEQKVAIILDGCWLMGYWKEKYPETLARYQFIPMPTQSGQAPGYTSMSGGWLFAINSKSTKKAEAFEFIKFAINKENSLNLSKITGNLTTREDVASMQDYPSYLKKPTEYLKFTHLRPANEEYPVVSSYIQKAVEAVATGQLTPDAAMKQCSDMVTKTLGASKVAESK